MTDAFVTNAPRDGGFVEDHTPHGSPPARSYPDYHPERPGATLGGRCPGRGPRQHWRMVPLARHVRVPPGYLPMTHAEWERWRYPDRFDWDAAAPP